MRRRMPVFVPDRDPDLFYWFDASNTSTIKGEGGAAITNGAQVYEWLNRKGAQKFVQSGTIARPTFVTSGPGGRPGVRFNGSHALRLDDVTGLTELSGLTGIIIASVDNPSETQTAISYYGPSAPSGNRWLVHVLNGNVRGHCRQNDSHFGVTGENGPAVANVPFIATATANYLNGRVVFCRDGIRYHQDQFDTIGPSPTTSPGVIAFGRQAPGIITSNEQWLTGYIFALMLWRRALTQAELFPVHHYLRTRWRIEPSPDMFGEMPAPMSEPHPYWEEEGEVLLYGPDGEPLT